MKCVVSPMVLEIITTHIARGKSVVCCVCLSVQGASLSHDTLGQVGQGQPYPMIHWDR